MNYQVVLPDIDYYRRAIKCQFACPVGTDARGYVNAIAQGEYELAYRIARESNPLASICGRVCNAPCEAACRRGSIDAPVAIRALKRFVTERYGQETAWNPPLWPFGGRTMHDRAALHRSGQKTRGLPLSNGRPNGRVAIVGAGPAGLACAHDLALLGHKGPVVLNRCTIEPEECPLMPHCPVHEQWVAARHVLREYLGQVHFQQLAQRVKELNPAETCGDEGG